MTDQEAEATIDLILAGQPRTIDGFTVARLLPAVSRRTVGPFCFFDHLGPSDLPAGGGLDVRPHPHINLATVTYVIEGAITHRDSLGSDQEIHPGAVNWMTAGRGIVHSERTPTELRAQGSRLHVVQLWVALPKAFEEVEPEFHHHPAATLPEFTEERAEVRLLAGTAFGHTSPVRTYSPLFYAESRVPAGSSLSLPPEHEERAAYVISGAIASGNRLIEERSLVIFKRGEATFRAERDSLVLLIGGAPLDGPRYLEWNFVSSSKERILRAKQEWREGKFPKVPGDEKEFIPLPEPK